VLLSQHFCGMILDCIRFPYRARMQSWASGDHAPVPVVWMKAPPGAKVFTGPSLFRSRIWDTDPDNQGPGEQHPYDPDPCKPQWVYARKPVLAIYRGQHACGSEQALRYGGIPGKDAPLALDEFGRCIDCGGIIVTQVTEDIVLDAQAYADALAAKEATAQVVLVQEFDPTAAVVTQAEADLLLGAEVDSTVTFEGGGGIVSAKTSMPVGSFVPYFGTLPEDMLACDGGVVSRTTYADLFALVGTTFGPGNGTTTFTLPDLRGRTIIGANEDEISDGRHYSREAGQWYGSDELVIEKENLPNEGIQVGWNSSNLEQSGGEFFKILTEYAGSDDSVTSGPLGSGYPLDITPPSLALNWGIVWRSTDVSAIGGEGATRTEGVLAADGVELDDATLVLYDAATVSKTAGYQGVRLPPDKPGAIIVLHSDDTDGVLYVYPPDGAHFSGLSTNVPIAMDQEETRVFYRVSATLWFTATI
jgi:hypothetical protein